MAAGATNSRRVFVVIVMVDVSHSTMRDDYRNHQVVRSTCLWTHHPLLSRLVWWLRQSSWKLHVLMIGSVTASLEYWCLLWGLRQRPPSCSRSTQYQSTIRECTKREKKREGRKL